ncbi:uncharacterized protein LOC122972769 isoform X1 [Thunnus albacares]|uniref:uncharacterized protein LOC122972769 isoform X1 n=1 Tax=Thunnus albacares TaxID=8236 RepID=UPI001CF6B6E3|nr:uncharacterized protein LOC122972769 isoform X1 [Thunnus albacares]
MARIQMFLLAAKKSDHVMTHAVCVALAVITQLCSIVFCSLAKDSTVPNALFKTSSRNVSETFPLEVTMDWWSESNWILTDIWSMAWLTHAMVGLCKRNVLGPVSCNPEIHSPVFYLMWVMINIARTYIIIMWDEHNVFGAVILTWFLPALSFYMLYMSYYNLNECKAWLAINNPDEIGWIRYLTQNGLALFAWWTLLKADVGLGIVLKYKAGLQDPLVSTIVLTVVLLCTLTWFIMQSFLFTKYMRYTFTVYAILILGLGAMFTRSYRIHDFAANTVYCGKILPKSSKCTFKCHICESSSWFLLSPGFLMLMMTIMSSVHLMSICLYKPPAMEPYVTSESCQTVCQPEGRSQQKLQN